jgi:CheY-like chemotaxis protein
VQDAKLVVLVVEDDRLVQEIIQEALAEGGFQTQVTASGEEAVALLERDQINYRALLTDIHLNGALTGWNVAKTCSRDSPRNSRSLHDGCRSRSVAFEWRAE